MLYNSLHRQSGTNPTTFPKHPSLVLVLNSDLQIYVQVTTLIRAKIQKSNMEQKATGLVQLVINTQHLPNISLTSVQRHYEKISQTLQLPHSTESDTTDTESDFDGCT